MAKKNTPKKKAAKKSAAKKKSPAKKITTKKLDAINKKVLMGDQQQAWERGESIGTNDEGDAIICERDTSGE